MGMKAVTSLRLRRAIAVRLVSHANLASHENLVRSANSVRAVTMGLQQTRHAKE